MKFLIFLLLLILLNPAVLILMVFAIILAKENKEYKESAYYRITKQPYISIHYNAGRYGEYLIYKRLKHMEANGAKFLFNVYIPKRNGETTEIDVLMICPKGIFVFESKNYSGWIFGSEGQKNWYQTLPAGRGKSRKEPFYNPVMQNCSHIKHLRTFLGEQMPMRSIIVFSDKCTLKSIQIQRKDISVINHYDVVSVVSEICNQTPIDLLNNNSIAEIYNKLYPFTQVDENEKARHIANVYNNLSDRADQQAQLVQTIPVVQKAETPEPEMIKQTAVRFADPDVFAKAATQIETTEPQFVEATQQSLRCPRCNGKLVMRTASRGANAGNRFYGCSNYPKCKYIQNITNNNKTV